MTQQIVLTSNTHPSNKLTSFQNILPNNYFNKYTDWSCAADSIGLHLNLNNKAFPKNPSVPSILQLNRYILEKVNNYDLQNANVKELPTRIFKYWTRYYIQGDRSYNSKLLCDELRNQSMTYARIDHAMYQGMLSQMNGAYLSFGQFDYPVNEDPEKYKNSSTYIFMHKNFYDAIVLDNKTIFKNILIGNEEYYYFSTLQLDKETQKWLPYSVKIIDDCAGMRIQIPKLIKVICSEVEPSHSSSGFQKILNVFTPNTNQKGSYIHKKFQNLIFHNTNIKDLTRLNIKLIDEDDEPLNLDLGGT